MLIRYSFAAKRGLNPVSLSAVHRVQTRTMFNRFVRQTQAGFSMRQEKKNHSSGEKKKDVYSTQFDDLLGKTSKKLTKEEQDFIDR